MNPDKHHLTIARAENIVSYLCSTVSVRGLLSVERVLHKMVH